MFSHPSPRTRNRRVAEENRIRVARACILCRNRKSRCVRTSAKECQRCSKLNLECVYEDISGSSSSPKRRAHELDNPLSPQFRDGKRRRQMNELESDAESGTEVRVLPGSPNESIFVGSPGDTAQNAGQISGSLEKASPTKNEAYTAPESALLLVENPGRTQYTGVRSNESFMLSVRHVFASLASTEMTKTLATIPITKAISVERNPSRADTVEALQVALKGFPPKNVATFLVSTFFYYVEATFFYCDRKWFDKSLENFYSGCATSDELDDSFVCFALLVFAFGSQFAHLRSNSDSRQQEDIFPGDPGKRFYDEAQKLMPRIMSKCSLKGVQVFLLAGLYNLPSNFPDTAYLYLGMGVRMALASGLHRQMTSPTLDPHLVEVRNRLWWSVYSIDRRISIALGRPTTVRDEEIDAPYPKPFKPLDDTENPTNVHHQIEYLKLTEIVNSLIRNLPLESKPHCVADVSDRLQNWYSELLPNLHPGDLLPGSRNFRATVHIQVHYHYAWIRMGRASLLQLVQDRLHPPLDEQGHEIQRPQLVHKLARSCVEAATRTAQLIATLKKHNLLCRFSFTDYQGSSSALIILLLNSVLEAGPDTFAALDDTIELLRFTAINGCEGAKSDLRTVEYFRLLAATLRQKIYTGKHTEPAASPQTGYQAWLKWQTSSQGTDSLNFQDQPGTSLDYSEGSIPCPRAQQAQSFSKPQENGVHSCDRTILADNFSAGDFQVFNWDLNGLDTLDLMQLFNGYTYEQGMDL